jgi:hypothetical protein
MQVILDIKQEIPIVVSLYLPILVLSYLAILFSPFLTRLFGLMLVLLASDFVIGFVVRELDEAVKILLACFLLQACVALLVFYGEAQWFLAAWSYVMHIILGIPVSFIGLTVRELLNPQ